MRQEFQNLAFILKLTPWEHHLIRALLIKFLEPFVSWRFDANLAKQIRISESKSLQIRLDATNVFNHPEPNFATGLNSALLNINQTNFGTITGATAKTDLRRQFQAQLRLNF